MEMGNAIQPMVTVFAIQITRAKHVQVMITTTITMQLKIVFQYRKGLSFSAIPQIIWKMGLCRKSSRIHDVQKSICTM